MYSTTVVYSTKHAVWLTDEPLNSIPAVPGSYYCSDSNKSDELYSTSLTTAEVHP